MKHDEKSSTQSQSPAAGGLRSRWFTADGKPIRVLSTSLGVALLANAILSTGVTATSGTSTGSEEPKLVSWSTEEVKTYFDKSVDWSIPLPSLEEEKQEGENATGSSSGSSGGGTTVVNHYGSGFGWDDLLLYHLLFNRGSSYSSTGWHNNRPAYNTKTNTPYKPKQYSSDTFQNKQVAGTTVKPKTSSSTGSITRRSTSSSPGGIGGKSSGLSSSSSSSGKSSSSVSSGSSSKSSKSSGFGG